MLPSAPRPRSSRPRAASRVVVVTGAGRGIGRVTAEAFAAEGHTVVVAELSPAPGARVARALARSGARGVFHRTDVSEPASVSRMVRAVLRRFGRIDVLVNNAGVLRVGELARLPVRELERMLAVNLHGPGRVWAENRTAEGAVFHVELPTRHEAGDALPARQ